MATRAARRPRVKAVANLTTRRTTRSDATEQKSDAKRIKLDKEKTETADKANEGPAKKLLPDDATDDDSKDTLSMVGEKKENVGTIPVNDVPPAPVTSIEEINLPKEQNVIDPVVTENVVNVIVHTKLLPDIAIEERNTLNAIKRETNNSPEQENNVPMNVTIKSPPKLPNIRLPPPSIAKAAFIINDRQSLLSPGLEEFPASPRNDLHQQFSDDHIKAPLSPAKFSRQRIRATPCFGNVRTTSQSESEAGDTKRQRHHSIGANGNFIAPMPMSPYESQSSRIRNDSMCSVASTDVLKDFIARKRMQPQTDERLRNSLSKREYQARLNQSPKEKSKLTMYDMIYYNPDSNPMMKSSIVKPKSEVGSVHGSNRSVISRVSSVKSSSIITKNEDDDKTIMPVPQLKIGPNGELILDEKSLVIQTASEKEAQKQLENAEVVYDDEFSGSSGFYRRQKRTRDWPAEETIKFYRCLHTVGTDFSMMHTLFPNRSRKDLKLKFKKEEKKNLSLINKALLYPKQFNIEELKGELDEEDRSREEAARLKSEKEQLATSSLHQELQKDKKSSTSTRAPRILKAMVVCRIKDRVNAMVNSEDTNESQPEIVSKTQQIETTASVNDITVDSEEENYDNPAHSTVIRNDLNSFEKGNVIESENVESKSPESVENIKSSKSTEKLFPTIISQREILSSSPTLVQPEMIEKEGQRDKIEILSQEIMPALNEADSHEPLNPTDPKYFDNMTMIIEDVPSPSYHEEIVASEDDSFEHQSQIVNIEVPSDDINMEMNEAELPVIVSKSDFEIVPLNKFTIVNLVNENVEELDNSKNGECEDVIKNDFEIKESNSFEDQNNTFNETAGSVELGEEDCETQINTVNKDVLIQLDDKGDAIVKEEDNPEEANTNAIIDQLSEIKDNLVIVEIIDTESRGIKHEIFYRCPETQELSDSPLDLPPEVVEQIRSNLFP